MKFQAVTGVDHPATLSSGVWVDYQQDLFALRLISDLTTVEGPCEGVWWVYNLFCGAWVIGQGRERERERERKKEVEDE